MTAAEAAAEVAAPEMEDLGDVPRECGGKLGKRRRPDPEPEAAPPADEADDVPMSAPAPASGRVTR